MARPRKSEDLKKIATCLTLTKEVKQMFDAIRETNQISISEFIENAIKKEYRKLVKNGKIEDNEQIPGQMSFK